MQAGRGDLRVEVGARAELHGRVLDIAPGASLRRSNGIEVLVLGGHGTLRTVAASADGTYRFADLQPGSYVVRAFPASARTYRRRLLAGIFPLSAVAVDATKVVPRDVTLVEGETSAFDIALDLPPTGSVEGMVTINDRPGKDGRATVLPFGNTAHWLGLSMRADVDEFGRFVVEEVPPGAYELRVYGSTRQELHRQAIQVAAGEMSVVQVRLAAGGRPAACAAASWRPTRRLPPSCADRCGSSPARSRRRPICISTARPRARTGFACGTARSTRARSRPDRRC